MIAWLPSFVDSETLIVPKLKASIFPRQQSPTRRMTHLALSNTLGGWSVGKSGTSDILCNFLGEIMRERMDIKSDAPHTISENVNCSRHARRRNGCVWDIL